MPGRFPPQPRETYQLGPTANWSASRDDDPTATRDHSAVERSAIRDVLATLILPEL